MDVVRVTQKVITYKGTIQTGDVFIVESRLGGWRINGGTFDGYFLQDREVELLPEFVQVKRELLQRREEVAALREEKRLLQEEIEKLTAEKRVSLPREVAEAIEECKNAWNPFGDDIYLHFLNIDGFDERTTSGRILASYARSKPFEYMSALVNGYTVEQSPAERLKQGIQQIYEQWTHAPSTGDDQADGADLAERITKFVTAEVKL